MPRWICHPDVFRAFQCVESRTTGFPVDLMLLGEQIVVSELCPKHPMKSCSDELDTTQYVMFRMDQPEPFRWLQEARA